MQSEKLELMMLTSGDATRDSLQTVAQLLCCAQGISSDRADVRNIISLAMQAFFMGMAFRDENENGVAAKAVEKLVVDESELPFLDVIVSIFETIQAENFPAGKPLTTTIYFTELDSGEMSIKLVNVNSNGYR